MKFTKLFDEEFYEETLPYIVGSVYELTIERPKRKLKKKTKPSFGFSRVLDEEKG